MLNEDGLLDEVVKIPWENDYDFITINDDETLSVQTYSDVPDVYALSDLFERIGYN